MVVLLDKPLTERQLWVLEYLSGFPVNGPHQWVGAASYFDDEMEAEYEAICEQRGYPVAAE